MRAATAVLLAWVASACATWTPVQRNESWTLYVKDREAVDVERFGRVLAPAFEAIEERMGRFVRPVRVHAWDSDASDPSAGPQAGPPSSRDEVHDVEGIGPARVRAFHVKGGAMLFHPSGVFLGVPDVGTAVHELVHARVAELGLDLPLWFEEGVASLWGDGALHEGRWWVDGLACWPLRELREQALSDGDLRRLIALRARDEYDARDNLLVHFLGWALVFDLAREAPHAHWLEWRATFERECARHGVASAARARLERALADEGVMRWLAHLRAPEAGRRLAAAKGLWKLRDVRAIDAMLDAFEGEPSPELRVALALNVLLASGETRVGRTRWNRLAPIVFPTLRELRLPDDDEDAALREVYANMRRWSGRGGRSTQDALRDLARLWEE